MSARSLVLIASLLSSGLMAGFFYGWTVSVIRGTALVDDHSYITTMQNINREILNPWFIITFLATPVVLIAGAVIHFRAGQSRRGTALAAAAATYILGVFAVTAGGNVPLNDALDSFDLSTATNDTMHVERLGYETPWNRWHNLRTLASVAALGFTALACTLADSK